MNYKEYLKEHGKDCLIDTVKNQAKDMLLGFPVVVAITFVVCSLIEYSMCYKD